MEWPQVFAWIGAGMWLVATFLYVFGSYLRRSTEFAWPYLDESRLEQQIKRFSKAQNIARIGVIYMTIRITFTFAISYKIHSDMLMMFLGIFLPALFNMQGCRRLFQIDLDKRRNESG
jgi:uncharacterized membrane protein YbaN (DUF454 family)